jgi:oxygen-independent coproporphyrinogen-3 oxidase
MLVTGRKLISIFIGGGTPSLCSAATIGQLIEQTQKTIPFAKNIEITLEANPGTVDAQRFIDYRAAGVNRLSIGIQSLNDQKLKALGRIHGRKEAIAAIHRAQQAGFTNINLDLMYGLPQQTHAEAIQELNELISYQTSHLSWYQLTLEPNTFFYQQPPPVPDDDTLAEIMQAGQTILSEQSYQQYEISAYSQAGKTCQHNLNYWQFGDYLGIGAGAHSKLTFADGRIQRRIKQRHPNQYQQNTSPISQERLLTPAELPIEFMLNALRLRNGVPTELFQAHTGIPIQTQNTAIHQAIHNGLLHPSQNRLQPTTRGQLFLNDLIALFDTDTQPPQTSIESVINHQLRLNNSINRLKKA